MNSVEPHNFSPFKWWDKFLPLGRCNHCYFPRDAHPIRSLWAVARPMGDGTYYELEDVVRLQLKDKNERT